MKNLLIFLVPYLLLSCSAQNQGGGEEKPTPLKRVNLPLDSADVPREVNNKSILIKGARLILVSAPSIEKGWILLKDGNIADFGAGEAPKLEVDQTIDATGKVISPGVIDTHSHMGVYPHPGVKAHSDGNEMISPNTADVWAENSFWPQDPALWRALSSGVTTIQVLPGSANLFGGRSFTAKMRQRISAREMRFVGAPQGLKMACGENPKRVYGEKGGPATRMGNVAGYDRAYQEAFEYNQTWMLFQRDLEHWQKQVDEVAKQSDEEAKKQALKAIGDAPTPPKKDAKLETLRKVMKGEILVHIHCYRADEMSLMLDMAKKYGFNIRSFHHAIEGYKIAKKLAEHKTGISTWADWWGFKMEAYDATSANAAITEKYGVKTIIHSDSAEDIRHLNHEVAKVLRAGKDFGISISEEKAMAWITLNAAWALGIEDKVGSLEKGKHADLVIWDRHPLSIYAKPDQVLIDGHIVFDREKEIVPSSDFEIGNRKLGLGTREHKAPQGENILTVLNKEHYKSQEMTHNNFLIKGVSLLSSSGVLKENQDLLISKGKITKVSPGISQDNIKAKNIPIIDGKGKILTPGLFEAVSYLGLMEVGTVDSTKNISIEEGVFNPSLESFYAFNSQTSRIPIERSHGVVYTMAMPNGGVLSGKGFFFQLSDSPGTDLVKNTAMFGSVSVQEKGAFGNHYAKLWQDLRLFVDEALFYQNNQTSFNKRNLRNLKFDERELLAFMPVLKGKLPFVVSANSYDEIRHLLDFVKEMRRRKLPLKVVLFGATESWMLAKELKNLDIPVVLNATNQTVHSFSHMQNRDDLAASLAEQGVEIALTAHEWFTYPRRIRQSAGMAVANGLDYSKAIQAITINPAQIYGLENKYARLKQNQPATFVLWNADPLEPLANAERIWIDGKEVSLDNRQRMLARKYLVQ
jgi:imidazolonepropionase-like amidohydrolase